MHGVRYAPAALLLTLRTAAGRMAIDAESARALELVVNARTRSRAGSLLAVVDRTRTPLGARFLRAQLLAPSADEGTLAMRLDCVEEILADAGALAGLSDALPRFLDVDGLLAHVRRRWGKGGRGGGGGRVGGGSGIAALFRRWQGHPKTSTNPIRPFHLRIMNTPSRARIALCSSSRRSASRPPAPRAVSSLPSSASSTRSNSLRRCDGF
jgi:hypothetical protein